MKSIPNKSLKFPFVDLKNEIDFPIKSDSGYEVYTFSHNRQLFVSKREVIVVIGSVISKRLSYNDDVVSATYTSFKNIDDALVICFSKSARILYDGGRVYVVSFPFILKAAFPFESGLILEKDQSQHYPQTSAFPQLSSSKFLTLVDPIGDFRIITTSSTSIISNNEELMTFPISGLNKTSSLCATYNPQDHTVNVYNIKAPSRASKKPEVSHNKYSKRKHSLLSTPNPNRILDEDIQFEGSTSSNQHAISFNMEKKRTSTLLSDASSMARMSGDHDPNKFRIPELRKDMIFTKVDVLNVSVKSKSALKVYGLSFEDQEAIVVVNKIEKEAKVYIYKQNIVSRSHTFYSIACNDCIPLRNSKYKGYIVVLKTSKSLSIVNPFLDIISTRLDLSSSVQSLRTSCEERVILTDTHNKFYSVRLALEPTNACVASCLNCFKYLSGSKINESIWMLWRTAVMVEETKDEWKAFVITLLSLIYPFDSEEVPSKNEITQLLPQAKFLHQMSQFNYVLGDLIPYITISLHLLREELRLDQTSKSILHGFNVLLTQLCTWMGWPDSWTKYYMIDIKSIDTNVRFLSILIYENPPNLFQSLASLFGDNIIRYVTFSQLVEEGDSIDALITPRTYYILKLFELVVSSNYGPNAVVDMMCEYGLTKGDLETYPPGIAIPLKEAISLCQENPSFEWTNKELELVGRNDLSLTGHSVKVASSISENEVRDINQLLSRVLSPNEGLSGWDGQSEADRIGITKLIFDFDRRFFEITTLLHQTKLQTAYLLLDVRQLNEFVLTEKQRELAALIALRTLTIPLGRAILFYSGRKPLLTEKFPIPKFNLNTIIAPQMKNIVIEDSSIPQRVSEWGHFHNGASSGLSISKEAKGISGSWIIFNKPPELNAQHAGFLLGLGLNGHLKKLEEWHIYNYLGPKHPSTSVGLLIGMAASSRGTMDNKLTKVLSVHAVALLPQGANDLNVPIVVQTAGLIGIGLLYLETQHRRMSEILLTQITSAVYQNDTEQIHEGYRLAAGISLGFINLGKGDDLRGLNDTHVVDKLLSLAISMKDYQPVQELDKSCCGAVVALGFIYMKTENIAMAEKLRVPMNEQLLDYIRPDLLFLRCVSRNLILWSSISNNVKWVESQFPPTLNQNVDKLDSDYLAYFNILGGTCLSIAVKYASTHDITARNTLLHYLDKLMLITSNETDGYDQKSAYHSACCIQNIIALSLSVVMAGSGDLEVLRRLRILYNDTSKEIGYGYYMAINTALGFLFLGGGQFAFSNSNFSIACLIVSLYPIFPNDGGEIEIHLQALRHFWSLSVEPRCLIIRDVNTQKPCKLPVTILLKDGQVIETLSPCLLPNLDNIEAIETKSSDYFNTQIDFQLNSAYLEAFKKSLTILVYKRKNYTLLQPDVSTLIKNENKALQVGNGEISINDDMTKLLKLDVMRSLGDFERKQLVYESSENEDKYLFAQNDLSFFKIIDDNLDLEKMARNPKSIEDLWNLRLLFAFTDSLYKNDLHYLSVEFIEQLKQLTWKLSH
ncbi:anaphase-promoting complex, subunit 1 [Scheffersomyces coipomensis]|uniref:anaphase-promoting complex, subunit 1 n=1 Tax=Scheffersomyces coipomensis TaxID=1788519 RepID=UPI00315C9F1F